MLILLGLAVAAVVYVVSGGRLVFLPLFVILPLGLFGAGRRRRGWRR
jgi:hypothetical protein